MRTAALIGPAAEAIATWMLRCGLDDMVDDEDLYDAAKLVMASIGTQLIDVPPCTEHESCTCRFALVSLGLDLKRVSR